MTKVIQIREVPDDVHAALTRAAGERGISLTAYLNDELAELAGRPDIVRHNSTVVRRTQRRVGAPAHRDAIAAALRDVRGEA